MGVNSMQHPIYMKHENQPQSLRLTKKGMVMSVMMSSINIHIGVVFFIGDINLGG